MTENFSLEKRMFDSSAISDYQGCPKLFYYRWVKRLEAKEEKPSLVFGKVFHDVLLNWYKTGKADEAIKEFSKLPTMMTDDHRTKEWGEAIFKQYVERYKTEQGKTLYLEKKFVIEIGEKLYAGRIDRIEDWNGQVYVDDHKTTSSLGLSFFNNYRPHPQIDGYCYACREVVGKCAGAIINGISVAKNPKERFQRFPSSRTDAELDQFAEVFEDWTDDIERDVECGHFAKNTSYCNRWGKCRFWNLCVYGEDERYIEQNYKVEEVKNGQSESDKDNSV